MANISSFRACMWRLLQEAMQFTPKTHLAAIVSMDIAAASARGAIIVCIALFADYMQGDSNFIPAATFGDISAETALFVMCAVLLVLLLINAVAAYRTAILLRRIGRKTHVRNANSALEQIQHLERLVYDGPAPENAVLARHVHRDALHSGIAIETILRLFQPVFFSAVALSLMLSFDTVLTASLSLAMILIAPVMYVLLRRINRNAREFYQDRIVAVGRAVATMVNQIDSALLWRNPAAPPQSLETIPVVTSYLDSYDKNRLANEHVAFILAVFQGVVVVGGLGVFGSLILSEHRSWSTMIGFGGSLFFLMGSIQAVMSGVTVLNRFFPQIQNLQRFLDLKIEPAVSRPDFETAVHVQLDVINSLGAAETHGIQAGELVFLNDPRPLCRRNFPALTASFSAQSGTPDAWQRAGFVQSGFNYSLESSAVDTVGFELTNELLALGPSMMAEVGLEAEAFSIDGSQLSVQWSRLNPRQRHTLCLMSLLAEPAPVVFVDGSLVYNVGKPALDLFAAASPPRVIVIVSNRSVFPAWLKPVIALEFNRDDELVVIADGVGTGRDTLVEVERFDEVDDDAISQALL